MACVSRQYPTPMGQELFAQAVENYDEDASHRPHHLLVKNASQRHRCVASSSHGRPCHRRAPCADAWLRLNICFVDRC